MPLGKSEYNCLWIKSGYMMTILSQQFFLHNRYSKYQQMVCEGIIEPEELPSIELLHGFMGCEFIFKLFSGRITHSTINSHKQEGGTTKHSPRDPTQVQAIYEKSIWNKHLLLRQEWSGMYASMWCMSWGRLQQSTYKFP